MALVDGGDLVARAIKQEGVDTTFTPCGGHVQAIHYPRIDHTLPVRDVRPHPVRGGEDGDRGLMEDSPSPGSAWSVSVRSNLEDVARSERLA